MTTINKLKQLKQAYKKKRKASGQELIFVHMSGDDFGTCNGKRLSLAEWDAIKGDDCRVIDVKYNDVDLQEG